MSKRGSRRKRREERAKAPALSEVFAPAGAPSGSLYFIGGPVGRRQPRRGTRELLEAYVDAPWMRAVVGRVSYAVASTPWRLFRSAESPSSRLRTRIYRGLGDARKRALLRKDMIASGELEPIGAHGILDLIERGGPRLSGRMLRQTAQAQIDTAGESFLLLDEFTPQRPPTTWVNVPPHLVCTIPGPFDDPAMFEVQSERGEKKQFPAERVLWLRDPNPAEPYGRGSGIGRALADEIDTDESAAQYARAKLQNGGLPNAIAHLEGAQPEAAAAFQERFNAQFQGSRNAGRVHLTGGPKALQVHVLDYSPADMKLNELREAERNVIFQVFGIPPEILGLVENSNRATIEGSHFIFAQWCVVPRLEMWRDLLQTQLVPLFDSTGTLILDFENPVDEDRERQVRVAQAAPYAFRVDEMRALADHAPLDDGLGDRFVGDFSHMATSEPAGELDSDPLAGLGETTPTAEPTTEPTQPATGGGETGDGLLPTEVLNGAQVQALVDLCNQVLIGFPRDSAVNIAVVAFGLSMETAESIIPTQGEAPAAPASEPPAGPDGEEPEKSITEARLRAKLARCGVRIRGTRKDLSPDEIEQILRSIDDDTLRSALSGLHRQAVLSLGQQLLQQSGLDIQFEASPRVVEFLRDFSSSRITAINETTRSQIRDSLQRGILDGDSLDDLAARIGRVFDTGITSRSRAIANTEVVRASGFSAVEGMTQGNIPSKAWISARDSRVRDAHAPGSGLDGQVVRTDAPFIAPGGQTAQHPGAFEDPALSVNCRCVVVAIFDDEDVAAIQTESARAMTWKRSVNSMRIHEGRMVIAARRAFRAQRAVTVQRLRRILG